MIIQVNIKLIIITLTEASTLIGLGRVATASEVEGGNGDGMDIAEETENH